MEEIIRNVVLRSCVVCGSSNIPASGQFRLQKVLSSSSSSPSRTSSVTVERINDNLSFRRSTSAYRSPGTTHGKETPAHFDTSCTPIVLIYAWLAAKSRHIYKLGDFYLAKGFDVLHIKVTPRQILWPPLAHSVATQILHFITSPPRHHQPIVVHGFSVGGYLYGETLVHIMSDVSLADSMSRRIRGQIFDSPVDFEGVPRGVGNALSNLKPVQLAIKTSLEAYMAAFQHQVTSHYIQSSETFRENPLRTPSLVLYSKADVVGTPGPIESLISMWRGRGVSVSTRCWEHSRHVQHYLRDPFNYTAELNQFLDSVGLVQHDDHDDEQRHESVVMPSSKL